MNMIEAVATAKNKLKMYIHKRDNETLFYVNITATLLRPKIIREAPLCLKNVSNSMTFLQLSNAIISTLTIN